MAVKVDKELFAVFWNARGGEYCASDEVKSFLYQAMYDSDDDSYLDMIYAEGLGDVFSVDLDSWESIASYAHDAGYDLIDVLPDGFEIDPLASTSPRTLFSKPETLLSLMLSRFTSIEDDSELVWAIEISNDDRVLHLVYHNLPCWGLGHGDSVLVVEHLSEVASHKGYFKHSRDVGEQV